MEKQRLSNDKVRKHELELTEEKGKIYGGYHQYTELFCTGYHNGYFSVNGKNPIEQGNRTDH